MIDETEEKLTRRALATEACEICRAKRGPAALVVETIRRFMMSAGDGIREVALRSGMAAVCSRDCALLALDRSHEFVKAPSLIGDVMTCLDEARNRAAK